jgi:hypothetical protein
MFSNYFCGFISLLAVIHVILLSNWMSSLENRLNKVVDFPNAFSYIGSYATIGFGVIGTTTAALVLISNLGKPNSESAKILLSLCVADLIFSFTFVVYSTGNILHGGFCWGLWGCYVNSILLVMSACSSIFTLGAAALERYLAVCKGITLKEKQVALILIITWTYSVVFPLIPFLLGEPSLSIEMEPTHWTCVSNWPGRNLGSRIQGGMALLLFGVNYAVIIFSYYSVYVTFANLAISSSNCQNKIQMENQRKVFLKCIVLTGSFIVLWTPYSTKIVNELLTKRFVEVHWSTIASLCASISSCMNPLILIKFDNRLHRHLLDFLGHTESIRGLPRAGQRVEATDIMSNISSAI